MNFLDLPKEFQDQVIQKCVETLLEKDSYNSVSDRVKNAVAEKVATAISEKYYREHELEVLKLIDVDTIARLATLKLITKVAERLG